MRDQRLQVKVMNADSVDENRRSKNLRSFYPDACSVEWFKATIEWLAKASLENMVLLAQNPLLAEFGKSRPPGQGRIY